MKHTGQTTIGRTIAAILLVGLVVAGTASLTSAHQGAKGIVKERMDLMSSIAKRLKLVLQTVRGEKSFDAKAVSEAASAIADHADRIPKMYPKGSGGHPSEATDKVWEQWDEFVRQAEKMKSSAGALANKSRTAKNGKDIEIEFKQLAARCSSCHGKFRVKK